MTMPPTKRSSDKNGLPPGTLIHIGDIFADETAITVTRYNRDCVETTQAITLEDITSRVDDEHITWVLVEGLQNVALIGQLGQHFQIHPLVMEDILNTRQRPKLEEHDEFLFIVLKGIYPHDEYGVIYEQVSIVWFEKVVLIFKEKDDEMFDPVITRLNNTNGRFRSQGADYLTYVLLDTLVDEHFVLMDEMNERLNAIEDALLLEPTPDSLGDIQSMKRELIQIRRFVSPLRELLVNIQRSETYLIQPENRLYFSDVLDHALRVMETTETYREILAGLTDIYISSVSNRMNEVMKVLTVFASIFIPLTFIAGIYGMNFDYMPELHWKWAYPTLWIAFIVIPIVLLVYFRKKKWL